MAGSREQEEAQVDKQAGASLGEAVRCGVRLDAPHFIKDAGGLFGRLLSGATPEEPSLPGEGAGFYVAVGPTKLGFFALERGWIRNSLGALLAVYPRAELQVLDVSRGYAPAVRFLFTGGKNYVFLCARIQVGRLRKAQRELEQG